MKPGLALVLKLRLKPARVLEQEPARVLEQEPARVLEQGQAQGRALEQGQAQGLELERASLLCVAYQYPKHGLLRPCGRRSERATRIPKSPKA